MNLAGHSPPLGVIEGYYGRPWTWEARAEVATALAGHGYRRYLYAPKADAYLRRRWREPHPVAEADQIANFARRCAALSVTFGVGLSPFELYRDFSADAKAALADKLAWLDDLGVRHLAILFDDMRGDLPGLAEAQVEILHWIAARSRAERLILCPTYYSDDPVLDRVFGARPADYLTTLGRALDPRIEVFWTGPEVCARELKAGHFARVAETLRRKPLVWDNYPVNDGPRMSPFLHLRAFTGRSASLADVIAGHMVNPALQPVLSLIPLLTLVESYRLGEAYDYGEAFGRAARAVLGADLALTVESRLSAFQDLGLAGLGDRVTRLRPKFAAIDHPAAQEIVAWLDGDWEITQDALEAS